MTGSGLTAQAERGMSAPPEVVFNTAIDPNRVDAWLPERLRDGSRRPEWDAKLTARWSVDGWSARLWVRPETPGGALVCLELVADGSDEARLTDLAETTLANLAREVADNLNAG
ncbi:hypothetical protein ACFFWC_27780 [Plantactinospora siamensis]|uniref:SRPBCC family protein n=1 Tax=Plantactinospora siamensis TaxID=555372 RepID=A0ABV6NXW4_9ACTN